MESVICILFTSFAIAQLPACFLNAGDLTCVSQLSEADTANAVLAKISMGSSADLTSVIGSGGILCGASLLDFH
jgi:hypothetical protein